MSARTLPDLSVLSERHAHVALLWDERPEGRCLLGIGARRSITLRLPSDGDWESWNAFLEDSKRRKSWSLGWIAYDLHQSLELADANVLPPPVDGHPSAAPALVWWEPEVVMEWKPNSQQPEVVQGGDLAWAQDVLSLVQPWDHPSSNHSEEVEPLEPSWSRDKYLAKFQRVQEALRRGDLYEMNLCMPWTGRAKGLSSWSLFQKLAQRTRAPHSAYIQVGQHRVLCASPERFLEKRGSVVRSQPIKGTIRRGASDDEDDALRNTLQSSIKEKAENVMIVDLVRNDLSRVAVPNSVEVEELFGVHTFETVHQMISTVRCQIREGCSALDIFKATFPMGSMTGAPKLSAMSHIAELEGQERGIYSGTLGYQSPCGDWDFNVVIRSLIHCAASGRLDATVGGAITVLSDANGEYDECLLKAEALRKCLEP